MQCIVTYATDMYL